MGSRGGARGRVPGPRHHRSPRPGSRPWPCSSRWAREPGGGERRAWLEPFWAEDRFGEYIARGLLAEHALWQGDPEGAGGGRGRDRHEADRDGYGPPVIRVAAIGLSARTRTGPRGPARRGDTRTEKAEVKAAQGADRGGPPGAAYPRQPKFVLGIDGRGWLARAEAEWARARGKNSPAAWQAVRGHVRPRVRLRERPGALAAGRGAGREGAARSGPSTSGSWPWRRWSGSARSRC